MIKLEMPKVIVGESIWFYKADKRIKEANTEVYRVLEECQKRQNEGLQYAAQFRAK